MSRISRAWPPGGPVERKTVAQRDDEERGMKTILYRWLPMCAILFATGPVIAQGTDPSAALRQ